MESWLIRDGPPFPHQFQILPFLFTRLSVHISSLPVTSRWRASPTTTLQSHRSRRYVRADRGLRSTKARQVVHYSIVARHHFARSGRGGSSGWTYIRQAITAKPLWFISSSPRRVDCLSAMVNSGVQILVHVPKRWAVQGGAPFSCLQPLSFVRQDHMVHA